MRAWESTCKRLSAALLNLSTGCSAIGKEAMQSCARRQRCTHHQGLRGAIVAAGRSVGHALSYWLRLTRLSLKLHSQQHREASTAAARSQKELLHTYSKVLGQSNPRIARAREARYSCVKCCNPWLSGLRVTQAQVTSNLQARLTMLRHAKLAQ